MDAGVDGEIDLTGEITPLTNMKLITIHKVIGSEIYKAEIIDSLMTTAKSYNREIEITFVDPNDSD